MTSVLPRPARPAAELFDMDGTLIDSEHLWLRAEILTMERLGGSWSEADQAACLGGPLERAVDYMIERAGGGHDPADVAGHLLDDMESLLRSSPLVWQPGARALLKHPHLDPARRQRGVPGGGHGSGILPGRGLVAEQAGRLEPRQCGGA